MLQSSFVIPGRVTRGNTHTGHSQRLHVQARRSADIPSDTLLCHLHLPVQLRITHNSRRVLDLSTRLVQSSDNPHNRPLQHISKISNTIEAHASRPFVHNLYQPKSWP